MKWSSMRLRPVAHTLASPGRNVAKLGQQQCQSISSYHTEKAFFSPWKVSGRTAPQRVALLHGSCVRRRKHVGLRLVPCAVGKSASLPRSGDSFFFSHYDKAILSLAVPAFFSFIADPLMGVVDSAIVGRLGSAALGAVGLSTIIFNFGNYIFSFLLVLTTPKVAAAIQQGNAPKASQTIAQGLWVALLCGVCMTTLLWNGAPYLMQAMKAEPEVAVHAVAYLRARAVANPAVLALFVAGGSFRGVQDTKTPLFAALLSNLLNLSLDFLFVFGLGWGVAGAALATSVSQYLSCGILLTLLLRRGLLNPADLARPPAFLDVVPLFAAGLSLSLRNLLSIAVIMLGTSLVTAMGATTMAAHEVLRQVWITSSTALFAFDVAVQSLVAKHLGRGDGAAATQVLVRALRMAMGIACVLTVLLLAVGGRLSGVFSRDPQVAALVQGAMPLVALLMPLDAAASVLDGGLLGASDTHAVARTMIVVAVVVAAVQLGLQQDARWLTLLNVWASFKVLSLGRVVGALLRYSSPRSPFAVRAAAPASAAAGVPGGAASPA